MEEQENQTGGKSWWQFRSKLERRLIMTIMLLSLTLLAILAYIILTHTTIGNKVCVTAKCVKTSAKLLESMDNSVDPCADFERFACGKFLATSIYQANATGDLLLTEIDARRQFERVFDEAPAESDSIAHKNLKRLFTACMNRTRIDEGVKHLQRMLVDEMGGWPLIAHHHWDDTDFNWSTAITKLQKLGFRYELFFDLNLYENFTDNKNYLKIVVPPLSQQSLGVEFRKTNEEFLGKTVELFGGDKKRAMYDIHFVSDFTAELIKIMAKHQVNNTGHKMRQQLISLSEVENLSPQVSWRRLLSDISGYNFTSDDLVVFNISQYMHDFNALLKKTPRRVQANYIIWEVLKDMQVWYNLPNAPRRTVMERRHTCIVEVNKIMPLLANQVLAESDTTRKQRHKVREMLKQLQDEIKQTISSKNYSWMSDEQKMFVLQKVDESKHFVAGKLDDAQDFHISYCNKELFDERNFIATICKAKRASEHYHFDILFNKTTVETTIIRLISLDAMANAYYLTNNYIGIPTGLLQQMYDAQLPDYINYARIGHLIGHEISHVLSLFAQEHGIRGEDNNLWSNKSIGNYYQSHTCLIDLYENYTLSKYRVMLNGTQTLDENLADIIGTQASYEVFVKQQTVGIVALPGLEQFTPGQLFWVAFARYYCDPQETGHVFSDKVANDAHGISSFRIFSTLRNSDKFVADFQCEKGSAMNPEQKCNTF